MIYLFCLLTLLSHTGPHTPPAAHPDTLIIPMGGNCWGNYEALSANSGEDAPASIHAGGHLTNEGIAGWTDQRTNFTAWFRTSRTGQLHLWLTVAAKLKNRQLTISIAGQTHQVNIPSSDAGSIDAGQWTLTDTGYHAVRLEGGGVDIKSILVAGPSLAGPVAYVPNDEGNFFYWGRRGPSVHLNYSFPDSLHAEWFYNEVTVPVGQDIQGSYFMADGFAQGYFGMQVNSPTTRHILFSIWSPFQTDDPKAIPDSQKIVLVKKGEGVHAGEFGNEGSGGQSYLDYPWKAGNTYRFLVHAKPDSLGHTTFTAWFYAPEDQRWRLIASWSRPATTTWLKGLHSFLENFDPSFGDRERSVHFSRQWILDTRSRWTALTKARFTGDNTARKGYRLDYGGGVKGDSFYLRNGGFFSNYTQLDQWLQRTRADDDKTPDIDFTALP